MKTHCRQWVCGHCDCLDISLIFRSTTFDVRIRRQKSSNSANRVFYISLNKGYFGKAIFSRLFSARYHILKKKKEKRYWAYVAVVLIITLSILATCLVSSNCSVTHVRWGGGHFLSAVSMTARIFSALATWKQCCLNFELWNNTPAVLHCGVSGWRGGKMLADLVDQLTLECCHSFRFCGSCRKRIPIRDSSMPTRILSQCGVSSDVFISLIVPTTCSSICWD